MTAGAKSKATSANPKDILGAAKISLSKFPAVALAHGAHAMMNGSDKYGPYNWRDKSVLASIYVDACMRHVLSWFEGEEIAADSRAHHLGHGIACLAILLDALANNALVDDRPVCGNPSLMADMLTKLAEVVKKHKTPPTPDRYFVRPGVTNGIYWRLSPDGNAQYAYRGSQETLRSYRVFRDFEQEIAHGDMIEVTRDVALKIDA